MDSGGTPCLPSSCNEECMGIGDVKVDGINCSGRTSSLIASCEGRVGIADFEVDGTDCRERPSCLIASCEGGVGLEEVGIEGTDFESTLCLVSSCEEGSLVSSSCTELRGVDGTSNVNILEEGVRKPPERLPLPKQNVNDPVYSGNIGSSFGQRR